MEYNWNDILIVGDSFCGDRTRPDHWPQVFSLSLTGRQYKEGLNPRGKGFPGASWWSTRKNLLEELAKSPAKVLVICYTEPFRIPNDQNLGLNTRSVLSDIIYVPEGVQEPSEDFKKAAKNYYEHIISQEYHEWAYSQWFKEVDQIVEDYKIEKTIHFFCFKDQYNQHTFKNGITMTIPLVSYQTTPLWRSRRETPNHYLPYQNIHFGNNLANIIKNYPGNGVRLNTKLIGN